jgi:hypothetical protein
MLTACGDKAGSDMDDTTWKLTKLESEMGNFDAEQIDATGMTMSFEFKKDGTVVGDTFEGEAEWEQDGDTVSISADGTTIDCKINGDKFTMEMQGMKMEFTKQ